MIEDPSRHEEGVFSDEYFGHSLPQMTRYDKPTRREQEYRRFVWKTSSYVLYIKFLILFSDYCYRIIIYVLYYFLPFIGQCNQETLSSATTKVYVNRRGVIFGKEAK